MKGGQAKTPAQAPGHGRALRTVPQGPAPKPPASSHPMDMSMILQIMGIGAPHPSRSPLRALQWSISDILSLMWPVCAC